MDRPDYNENDKKAHKYFEKLFVEYYEPLCFYSYRFVLNTEIAEDLVQDVFFDLWLKRDTVDFTNPIQPYLYKATYNKSIDYIRHLRLKEEKLSSFGDFSFLSNYTTNSIPDQEDMLNVKEINREIEICISKLPPQCQKVFRLSREKNFKNREIAELLNVSQKAIEKQISKALTEIRLHLIRHHLLSFILLLFSRLYFEF